MVYINGTSSNHSGAQSDITATLRSSLRQLHALVQAKKDVVLDGHSLDLSAAVAVAQ